MPRIILKHKSPEYADASQDTTKRSCEMPGCPNKGDHKAPKHRGLNEYYNFCFDHIKEYNKAWDFFSGMSQTEVQNHMKSSRYGDRPTWKYNAEGTEEKLFEAAQQAYFYEEEPPQHQKNQSRQREFAGDTNTPEYEALAIMGLSPPITLDGIKTQYKTLAKKYHPDLNRNDPKCEEILKKINMAYTILKLAFQEYSKLKERD